MPDRLAEVKNVKDFEAKGDGVTDDTAAIQAAVNSIATLYSAQQSGTVYFPSGTYLISSPGISLNGFGGKSIKFVGEGYSSQLVGNFVGIHCKQKQFKPCTVDIHRRSPYCERQHILSRD